MEIKLKDDGNDKNVIINMDKQNQISQIEFTNYKSHNFIELANLNFCLIFNFIKIDTKVEPNNVDNNKITKVEPNNVDNNNKTTKVEKNNLDNNKTKVEINNLFNSDMI